MTTATKITKQDINSYNRYLDDALPCIEELKKFMGKDGETLDFSPVSLKVVDKFVKRIKGKIKYYKEDNRLTKDEKRLIVRLAYYLAQVIIDNFKWKWALEKRKSYSSFRRAVLRGEKRYDQVEPLRLALNLWKKEMSFYNWFNGRKEENWKKFLERNKKIADHAIEREKSVRRKG